MHDFASVESKLLASQVRSHARLSTIIPVSYLEVHILSPWDLKSIPRRSIHCTQRRNAS